VTPGRRYRLDVVVDRRLGVVSVRHHDHVLLDALNLAGVAEPPPAFTGTATERPFTPSVCRAVR
jgi:hypothetical protein